jgi:hypothetical protein
LYRRPAIVIVDNAPSVGAMNLSVLDDDFSSGFSHPLRKDGHTVARAAALESGDFPSLGVPLFRQTGPARRPVTRRSLGQDTSPWPLDPAREILVPAYCSVAASQPIHLIAMATRGKLPGPGKCVLVVRRGAKKRYTALRQHADALPLDVVWDRRAQDRRAQDRRAQDRRASDRRTSEADRRRSERRKGARRQPPPFTWNVADFLVALKPAQPQRSKVKRKG